MRPKDFVKNNYILAMDNHNLLALQDVCPPEICEKIIPIMSFSKEFDLQEVPDPYYGNEAGFERVCQLLNSAVRGFVDQLRQDTLV